MFSLIFVSVIYMLMFRCLAWYVVDDSVGDGRIFDGIGAISGGGATSKLLVNYPEPERSHILDYLFKPNFGASLQMLKVEIGGDSQSTDGVESSHMHDSWDENYQRGYEWWLMTEAKKRNPAIKLYGLPWAFPGWLADQSGTPYGNPFRTAGYVVKWVLGAQKYYGLHIDYIGIWNERSYTTDYIKVLRLCLDAYGLFNVTIVAVDGKWYIEEQMLRNSSLASAIGIIGVHYPGTKSTMPAMATGKKLWASEDYSTYNDNIGAGCLARILNQNYVNGFMTSTIIWNLIASYYQSLPFGRDGLMTAEEPWSGHYVVSNPIWVTAHTTQFTEIGWHYLKHGSGVGFLDSGGSYVSLQCPCHKHFTMIIETMSHDHSKCIRPFLPYFKVDSQQAEFVLKGSLLNISKLYVWYSKLGYDGSMTTMMKKSAPIVVTGGKFSLNLEVDVLYTLTTTDKGNKGLYPNPPVSLHFPLPYRDTFEDYQEYKEAPNFVPQVGVWEVHKSNDASHGKVNRQVILRQPCDWCVNRIPINIGGNFKWTDIQLAVDVLLPSINHTEGATLAARIDRGGCSTDAATGVFYSINLKNNTFSVSSDAQRSAVISRGKLSQQFKLDVWYKMTLVVKGNRAFGYLNSEQVFNAVLPEKLSHGFVGYGTTTFGLADFDNLQIAAVQH